MAAEFDSLRNAAERKSLAEDAVACFHAGIGLVVAVIGQDFKDGAIVLNPKLVKYLERQGVYEPPSERAV